MVKKIYSKTRRHCFLDFNPEKGHEQEELRPAVGISTNTFNQNIKMVILCPITLNNKELPTHYRLEDTINVHGSVLCEHVESIDYEIRNLKFVEKIK